MHIVRGALPTVNTGPAMPVAKLDTGFTSPVRPTVVDHRPVDPLRGSSILHRPGDRTYSPLRVYSPGRAVAHHTSHHHTSTTHLASTTSHHMTHSPARVVSPLRTSHVRVSSPGRTIARHGGHYKAYSPSRVIIDPVPRVVHPAPPTPPRNVAVMPARYVGTSGVTRQPFVPSSPTHLRSYVDGVSTTQGNPGKLRVDNGTYYDTRNYY